MKIYKSSAIEAIQTENLMNNNWFLAASSSSSKNCSVCAVGAILRKHCFTTSYEKACDANKAAMLYFNDCVSGDFYGNTGRELSGKEHLEQLSALFETATDEDDYVLIDLYEPLEPGSEEVRDLLCHHIETNWPEYFEIDIV